MVVVVRLFPLIAMFLVVIFGFRKRLYARLLRLRPPQYNVTVQRRIPVTMQDGITLLADHYFPQTGKTAFPTILIRSPYGREPKDGGFGYLLTFFACRFAERGYHVVTQDTRGRFRSGGEFNPYFAERNDGLDTIKWLEQQSWFEGSLGTWGPSYLGITQWAMSTATPAIKAMMPSVTSSKLLTVVFPDGSFDLGLTIRWPAIFQALDRGQDVALWRGLLPLLRLEKKIAPAFTQLPISWADERALGQPLPYYQAWLANSNPNSPMWTQIAQDMQVEKATAAIHLVGGWYDFFLRGLLHDYMDLKAVGKPPFLTIGPWLHFSNAFVMTDSLREGLDWFDAHLREDRSRLRNKPVRLYIMGIDEWRDYEEWPPAATQVRYYLWAARALSVDLPENSSSPDHYQYNPADPTPAVGGTQFSLWAGPRSNQKLEARPDVLVYTSAALQAPIEVIGQVKLELYVRSSLDFTDFFGRLCDVHPDGTSINICDGLFHITPDKGACQPDGSLRIEIDMWATAHCFRKGHRIRLQVSSGAHPRWNRNLGTGSAFATDTRMKVADQTIYHDATHPSALLIPIVSKEAKN